MKNDKVASKKRYYSIGGGEIVAESELPEQKNEIYEQNSFKSIAEYCHNKGVRIWQYVESVEGKEIWDYLQCVLDKMRESIVRGLETEGVLPGGIGV